MSNKTAHTPTPWFTAPTQRREICTDNGTICTFPPERYIAIENWAADSAFIVRAVNNIDSLYKNLLALIAEAPESPSVEKARAAIRVYEASAK